MSRYSDAGIVNIEVVRGKSEVIILKGWTKEGLPWDLTNEQIKMDIKPVVDINRYATIKLRRGSGLTAVGTDLHIEISENQTALLNCQLYHHDIVIGDTPYIKGTVTPSGTVTGN